MQDITPWYRQFWPWFIFGLPGIVVIAGLSTWWIAHNNADQLVNDDYYKEGLAINREMAKQELASELGISASLSASSLHLRLQLESTQALPAALQLTLSHPVNARLDTTLPLAQTEPGIYEARWNAADQPRWLWQLEPLGVAEQQRWRVDGVLSIIPGDAN